MLRSSTVLFGEPHARELLIDAMLGPVAQGYNQRTVILCKHATKNTGREALRSQLPGRGLEKKHRPGATRPA